MLVIFNERKYTDFKKSNKKPSEFCKSDLRYSNIKSAEFVKKYFENADVLMNAIREYKRVSNIKHGEHSLLDLLK